MASRGAIFFDLDGTLIDPFVGIRNAYRHMAEALDLAIASDDEVRTLIGPPVHEALAQQFHLRGDELDRALASYREYYGSRGAYEFTKFSGIDELLSDLCSEGFTLYVTTSKPTKYADIMVDEAGWRSCFAMVSGAEMDGSRRHKADVISFVLQNRLYGETVVAVVGDRAEDVNGARANGIACVGVAWGFGSADELHDAGAVSIEATPAALRTRLAEMADTSARADGRDTVASPTEDQSEAIA